MFSKFIKIFLILILLISFSTNISFSAFKLDPKAGNAAVRIMGGEDTKGVITDEYINNNDRINFSDPYMYDQSFDKSKELNALQGFPAGGTADQQNAYVQRLADEKMRYETNKQSGMSRDQSQSIFFDATRNVSNSSLQVAGIKALNYFTNSNLNPDIIGSHTRSNGELLTLTILKYIDIFVKLIAIIALAYIVYGGFIWLISPIYADKKKGITMVKWAIIAMVIISFAYTITTSYINKILSI